MKIELLKNHIHLIPQIAELRFHHYSHFAPTKTLQDFIENLEEHLNEKELPIAYVMVEEGRFVGLFCLRKNDLDIYPNLSPWLGGVFVNPEVRGKGVGVTLVKYAEIIARKDFGFDQLYLFTLDMETWYIKLGWKTIEYSSYNNHAITLMTKKI